MTLAVQATRETETSPTAAMEVMQQVWETLQEHDQVWDLSLQSMDGLTVRTCRLLLAARSPVWKNLLYSNVGRHLTTLAVPFDRLTLQAIVEYCRTNRLTDFQRCHFTLLCHAVRQQGIHKLIRLFSAAVDLQMTGLQRLVHQLVQRVVAVSPPLACVVLEEAPLSSTLADYALQMIQGRPYVTLDTPFHQEGGVTFLSKDRFVQVLQSPNLEAGEAFLFFKLCEWYEYHRQEYGDKRALGEAEQCAALLHYDMMDPQVLVEQVQVCPFVPRRYFTQAWARCAFLEQAWELQCRRGDRRRCGDGDTRVLVEGAGMNDVNGMYYPLQGLSNGQLYSKREVACGQEYVYTLSCVRRRGCVECRIIRNKLLTDQAVTRWTKEHMSTTEPVVVQIATIEKVATLFAPACYRVSVSDGTHFIDGFLSPNLFPLVEQGGF